MTGTIRSHRLNTGHRFEDCFVCGECFRCHAPHEPVRLPLSFLALCVLIIVLALAVGVLLAPYGWVRLP